MKNKKVMTMYTCVIQQKKEKSNFPILNNLCSHFNKNFWVYKLLHEVSMSAAMHSAVQNKFFGYS